MVAPKKQQEQNKKQRTFTVGQKALGIWEKHKKAILVGVVVVLFSLVVEYNFFNNPPTPAVSVSWLTNALTLIYFDDSHELDLNLLVTNNGNKGTNVQYIELSSDIRNKVVHGQCDNEWFMNYGGFLAANEGKQTCATITPVGENKAEKIKAIVHTKEGVFDTGYFLSIQWYKHPEKLPGVNQMMIIGHCEPHQKCIEEKLNIQTSLSVP